MSSKSNARLWGLKAVTPGMTAGAAVLARWTISRDTAFQAVGGLMGFNYAEAFDYYKEYIIVALEEKKPSARRLLAFYNKHLFPHKITEPENRSGGQLFTEMDEMMANLMDEESGDAGGPESDAQREPSVAADPSAPTSPDLNPSADTLSTMDDSDVQLADHVSGLENAGSVPEPSRTPAKTPAATQLTILQSQASTQRVSSPAQSSTHASGPQSANGDPTSAGSRASSRNSTKRRQETREAPSEGPADVPQSANGDSTNAGSRGSSRNAAKRRQETREASSEGPAAKKPRAKAVTN